MLVALSDNGASDVGVVVFHPGDDFAGKDIWIKFKMAKDLLS